MLSAAAQSGNTPANDIFILLITYLLLQGDRGNIIDILKHYILFSYWYFNNLIRLSNFSSRSPFWSFYIYAYNNIIRIFFYTCNVNTPTTTRTKSVNNRNYLMYLEINIFSRRI